MKYCFMQKKESESNNPYGLLHKYFVKHFYIHIPFLRKLSIVFLTHILIIHIILRTLYINTICTAGNILMFRENPHTLNTILSLFWAFYDIWIKLRKTMN